MNPRGNKLPSLLPFEWNFEPVPEDELEICFLYEYGREHIKHCKWWQELTKSPLDSCNEISAIFGKRNLSWFFNPSFFETPWQRIDKTLRRDEAKQFNQQQSEAQSFREFISLKITLQRDLPEYAPTGAKDFPSWVLLDECWHSESDQREYGFFALNWNYTDGQLIDEFKKWLTAKRDKRKDIESQQGKGKTRQYLKALGAKRLLNSGLTVKEAMGHTEKHLKDSKGHPCPLYGTDEGWSKAKNKTVPAILKRLFSS